MGRVTICEHIFLLYYGKNLCATFIFDGMLNVCFLLKPTDTDEFVMKNFLTLYFTWACYLVFGFLDLSSNYDGEAMLKCKLSSLYFDSTDDQSISYVRPRR